MKLQITLNRYKQTNAYLDVSADLKNVSAYSYGWWKFVATDKAGNVIFNSCRYSPSTGGHQSDVRDILRRLNMAVDLYIYNTSESLEDIPKAIQAEIGCLEDQIKDLDKAMARKGSHKRKNNERKVQIEGIQYRIKDLRAYLEHGRLPAEERGLSWRSDEHKGNKTFEPYFLKPNGVLKRNELQAFLKTLQGWHNAPTNIQGLKEFLGLKTLEDILPVLAYRYSQDLGDMIPAQGSDDDIALQKFVEKHRTSGINTLLLDKMHTFLINRQNRKEYVPREPEPLPLHPVIERLKGKDELHVIDNVQKLRAEGRRQSHCIGSQNYISLCRRGYQALNFKGYTFFLEPSLSIRETKGKYNSSTPESVVRELKNILVSVGA